MTKDQMAAMSKEQLESRRLQYLDLMQRGVFWIEPDDEYPDTLVARLGKHGRMFDRDDEGCRQLAKWAVQQSVTDYVAFDLTDAERDLITRSIHERTPELERSL